MAMHSLAGVILETIKFKCLVFKITEKVLAGEFMVSRAAKKLPPDYLDVILKCAKDRETSAVEKS